MPTLDVTAAVGPPLRDLGVLGVERSVQVVCAQGVGGHGRLRQIAVGRVASAQQPLGEKHPGKKVERA